MVVAEGNGGVIERLAVRCSTTVQDVGRGKIACNPQMLVCKGYKTEKSGNRVWTLLNKSTWLDRLPNSERFGLSEIK